MSTAFDEATTHLQQVTVNGHHTVGGEPVDGVVAARERVPGLTLRRVPSGSLLAQVFGALLVLVGLFWLCAVVWGLPVAGAVSMLTTGVATLTLGTLREAGVI